MFELQDLALLCFWYLLFQMADQYLFGNEGSEDVWPARHNIALHCFWYLLFQMADQYLFDNEGSEDERADTEEEERAG